MILEVQYLSMMKFRADAVETVDIGIKRGKMFERSLPYILKPSKVEASSSRERNLLTCTEAIGESGGGLEVRILLSMVMVRDDRRCRGLHEKSGWKALDRGLGAGSKRKKGREKSLASLPRYQRDW